LNVHFLIIYIESYQLVVNTQNQDYNPQDGPHSSENSFHYDSENPNGELSKNKLKKLHHKDHKHHKKVQDAEKLVEDEGTLKVLNAKQNDPSKLIYFISKNKKQS
jgi:hypothetical protein